jgi:hypothetical protein
MSLSHAAHADDALGELVAGRYMPLSDDMAGYDEESGRKRGALANETSPAVPFVLMHVGMCLAFVNVCHIPHISKRIHTGRHTCEEKISVASTQGQWPVPGLALIR